MLDLASTAIGALVALLGIYLTYLWNKRKEMNSERIALYARLLGVNLALIQSLYSRFEALAYSDYHEVRWAKTHPHSLEDTDFKEALRWMAKSEDLVKDVTADMRELYEILGRILVVYPHDEGIADSVERIFKKGVPIPPPKPENVDVRELGEWKNKTVKDLNEFLKREYRDELDHISETLRSYIRKGQKLGPPR